MVLIEQTNSGDMTMVHILNTQTEQKIIESLRRLPPKELDEVIQFIDFISERRHKDNKICESDEIRRSIQLLRGRGRGEQLVKRLLQSRKDDRKFDERK